MSMDISHIVNEKRHRHKVHADFAILQKKQPELKIGYSKSDPTSINGTYRLFDPSGVEQGNWEIFIPISKKYPFEFPELYETSNKIPILPERHMTKNGACVELDIITSYIANRGITFDEFFKRYVVRYFSWNLLYEAGETEGLDYWEHYGQGRKDFFTEHLMTDDTEIIKYYINLIRTNQLPSRNDPCICSSGKKYKKCHHNGIEQLKKYPICLLEKAIVTFKDKEEISLESKLPLIESIV